MVINAHHNRLRVCARQTADMELTVGPNVTVAGLPRADMDRAMVRKRWMFRTASHLDWDQC